MTSSYLIGLDLGTSAVKGILLSSDGNVVAREKEAVQVQLYEDGRAEFDAQTFYLLIADVIKRLRSAMPETGRVAGLAFASASGNTVLLGKDGAPLQPVISWLDNRPVSSEMTAALGNADQTARYDLIGWPPMDTFPLAHLSWLKVHEEELFRLADKIGMSTEYVVYRLTGEWAIDPSTATPFFLQDQKAGKWDSSLLNQLNISEAQLPQIAASGTIIGYTTADVCVDTDLPAGTPVVAGAFDHPSAARGAGVLEEGELLLSCGTSWVGFTPIRNRLDALNQNMLIDPFLQPDGPWGAMFSLPAIATGIEQWLTRYISDKPDRYDIFNELAISAPPGANGILIHPMRRTELELADRPSQADMARAIMEGTVYLLKTSLDKLEANGKRFTSVFMVGGPTESIVWPQIVSDVLGKEVRIVNGSCAGAAGAAIMAGIGTGLFADERDAIEQAAFPAHVHTPSPQAHAIHLRQYDRFLQLFGEAVQ
ncbi:FGGY-family carbohydrate kinase [Cohnella sp. GbtcB17]|uniref:xylulokinase n=1 Tax=Cohnella sp. GbtcB17 TaxID=2824762 RepID=UPI001C30197C|nr:FGGY-family carbohydrate kinase [Cohnella sp. GbtcB17]